MITKTIKTIIKLRKDTEVNYLKVAKSFIPANGEVCLVDTDLYGLRVKIGDGVSSFEVLNYQDDTNNVVLTGYLFNNNFYIDSTYTQELIKGEKHLYIDKNGSDKLYFWTNSEFIPVSPEATETVAGIMKLYQNSGDNIDGTMSQKVITDGVNSIKLKLDDSDSECLELDLPWD